MTLENVYLEIFETFSKPYFKEGGEATIVIEAKDFQRLAEVITTITNKVIENPKTLCYMPEHVAMLLFDIDEFLSKDHIIRHSSSYFALKKLLNLN